MTFLYFSKDGKKYMQYLIMMNRLELKPDMSGVVEGTEKVIILMEQYGKRIRHV